MTTAGPAGRVTAIGPVLYGMVQEREHTRMLLNVNARSVARSCGTSLDFAVCWDGGAEAWNQVTDTVLSLSVNDTLEWVVRRDHPSGTFTTKRPAGEW